MIFQGVDLSNIVLSIEEDLEIVKAVKNLKSLNLTAEPETIVENCDLLAAECKKGMAEKVLCSNHQGYEILVELAKNSNQHENVQASAIRALANLMDKNPDGLEVEGFSVIILGLDPLKGNCA